MAKTTGVQPLPVASRPERASRRTRSPNFPSISLRAAIDRARTIWEHENRHAASVDVLAEHWGYANFGVSGAIQTLAALRAFGLVEVDGRGDNRRVRLSDRALDIILLQSDDERRVQAIVDAARSPTLYAELIDNSDNGMLPSDTNIRSHLVRERGFNPRAVDGFIADFRDTIAFASEFDSDILSSSRGHTEKPDPSGARDPKGKQGSKVVALNPPSKDALPLPVLMGDGSFQLVYIPRMSAEAFEFFKRQLDTYKTAIIAQTKSESSGDAT